MIPESLAWELAKPLFWIRRASAHRRAYKELVASPVELGRASDYALRLRFLPPAGIDVVLEVVGPGGVTELVAIRERGSSHALRWVELEQLVRWAAVCTDLAHPGWLLALLAPGAPICDGDGAYPLHVLELALATTTARSPDVARVIEETDCRGAGFAWMRTGKQWTIGQSAGFAAGTERHLRSQRTIGGAFPHAVLAELLAEIDRASAPWRTERIRSIAKRAAQGDRDSLPILSDALQDAGCDRRALLDACTPSADRVHTGWVLELLLGLSPGAWLGPLFGLNQRATAVYWRNVYVSLPDCTPPEYLRIRASLAAAGVELGHAAHGSTLYVPVHLRGAFEPMVSRLAGSLRAARVPAGSTISIGWPPTRVIPV